MLSTLSIIMDNHDLNAVATFLEVARCGGFSAAARKLRIPRSTVSLRVRMLETSLGTRLFKRSTRSVALTDEGHALLERGGAALDRVGEALQSIGRADGELRGLIRMTAPADFPTAIIAAAVGSFRAAHPHVDFDLILTNAVIDLVANNVDVALRITSRSAVDTILRPLPPLRYAFYASPDYLRKEGTPSSLAEVRDFISPHREILTFLQDHAFKGAAMPAAAIEANNFALVRDLVLAGSGIGLIPALLCTQHIADGRLVAVLTDIDEEPVRMAIAFPTKADISARVRAFGDYLHAILSAQTLRL